MKKIIINEYVMRKLNRKKKIIKDNSQLIKKGSRVYIIFDKTVSDHQKCNIVEYLMLNKDRIKDAFLPMAKLYNKDYKFIGYTIKFLRGFVSLENADLSLEDIFIIIEKLNNIIRNFISEGKFHMELFPDNVLVRKKEIKLLAMDSLLLPKYYYNTDIPLLTNYVCRSLAMISLNLLYNCDTFSMEDDEIAVYFKEYNEIYLNEIVNYILKEGNEEFYIDTNKLDIDKMPLISKKEIKKLKNML